MVLSLYLMSHLMAYAQGSRRIKFEIVNDVVLHFEKKGENFRQLSLFCYPPLSSHGRARVV